jgi:phosphoethanolamine N-methyltransferase
MTVTDQVIAAADAKAEAERQAQKAYWTEHSKETTVEAMMLDSQAKLIDLEERPEILRMLGSIEGKVTLELGAGIGRFTGPLAQQAKHLIALDFMPHLIEENQRQHADMGNIDFRAGDALELVLKQGSMDVVFSNWLMMYLGDKEVTKLATDALSWLNEGGIFFYRESCFRQSGDKARKNNPTHYRNPREYFAIMDGIEQREADGRFSHWELISCKCVDTYVRLKKNQNQICWKWRKVCSDMPRAADFRHFLDNQQYQLQGILRYERVFGHGFVSTGGLQTTQDFVSKLDLQPGQRVLDVGCGIGGGDFYMAHTHGVSVHGIDLSVNMVLTALNRAAAGEPGSASVSFEIADCTMVDFGEAKFDVIYSRDTLLHIADKPALFQSFMRWLKPGGKLLISDYCRTEGTPSPGFAAYIKQRGYDLHSVEGYGRMLEEAGFSKVIAEDRTWQFEESLRRELDAAVKDKDGFIAEFSQADFDAIVNGWKDKLARSGDGEQRWGLFQGTKIPAGPGTP